jgi:hypothetical protein
MSETLTEQVLRKGKNKKQKGGGSKKIGRNKASCLFYRQHRYKANKMQKLLKHLANHVNDVCAQNSYDRLRKLA